MPSVGYKQTEEHKNKVRLYRIGKKHNEKTKTKIGVANSIALIGRKLSEKHKENIRINAPKIWKGKKLPPEIIEKIRMSKIGCTTWNKGKKGIYSIEHRKKISEFLKTRPVLIETRKKIGEKQKGEKSHLWRGGVTPINHAIRNSLEYTLWREAVFKRDDYTCVWCGARSGVGKVVYLQADHIKQFAYYPELRFAIDNGRTLCVDCHRKTDTFGARATPEDLAKYPRL